MLIQVSCDCFAVRAPSSAAPCPRASAGGIRRIRSSASSTRATRYWPPGKELDGACRRLAIADSTWYRWLAQCRGMKANDAKQLKELDLENARLKKLLTEAELDKSMLKDLAEGNL